MRHVECLIAAEAWLLRHNFAQAEGVTNLDQVPEAGGLIIIGYAKPEGGTGGFARYIAVAPASWPHGVTIEQAPGAPLPVYPVPLRRGSDGVLRRSPWRIVFRYAGALAPEVCSSMSDFFG
jgi:hypothetical protein